MYLHRAAPVVHTHVHYICNSYISHSPLEKIKLLIKKNKPSSKNILAMLCRKFQIPPPSPFGFTKLDEKRFFWSTFLFMIAQSRKSMLKRGYSLPFATSSVEETLGPTFSPFFPFFLFLKFFSSSLCPDVILITRVWDASEFSST